MYAVRFCDAVGQTAHKPETLARENLKTATEVYDSKAPEELDDLSVGDVVFAELRPSTGVTWAKAVADSFACADGPVRRRIEFVAQYLKLGICRALPQKAADVIGGGACFGARGAR